jgi:origin recognition complex subunit 1
MFSNAHIFQCVVYWRLNSVLLTLTQGEIHYYHCKDSVPTDLSSILRKCIVKPKVEKLAAVSRNSPTKRTTSNHSPSKSRSRGLQRAPSPTSDDANDAEDEHTYYINRSCHLASNSFYEINWPDFRVDKCGVQGDCEGSQWQLDPGKDVKGHKVARKQNNDIDETSSSESDDSEDEYGKEREQNMEGSEASDEEDADMGVPEYEDSGEGEGGSDESPTSLLRLLKTPNKKRKRNVDYYDDPFKTPSKRRRRAGAEPTPHSKAALRKRRHLKFKIKPPTATTQDNTTLQGLPADPYLRAMYTLHVGERPDTLPCRDEEYVAILEAVLELLQETSGGCICEHNP